MQKILPFILTLLMTAAGSQTPAWGQGHDENADLDALYQQLDEAIELAPQYVARQEQQISSARRRYLGETKDEERLRQAERLFGLYKYYRNDSALSYAAVCVALADSLHRPDLAGRYRSLMARQYSNADQYVEAVSLLRLVDRAQLDRRGLTAYYEAWMHVCGQIGSYTALRDVRQGYYDCQDLYRDSVLAVAEAGSEEFLHLKMDVLCARRQFQDALNVSDSWLGKVADGTHENAFAAFYRFVVYSQLGNDRMERYWLAKSALDDIKCAVSDQASILMLAERLCEDGDIDRASRYAEFGRACNTAFSGRLRNYQVGLVTTVLEQQLQASRTCCRRLTVAAAVLAVLLAALATRAFVRRHRR